MTKKYIGLVLILALSLVQAACKQELYSGVPEGEANSMMSILLRNNIGVEKLAGKDNLFSIVVEADKISLATELLKERGYPKEKFENMGQIFKKEGLVSSPLEERVRFIYALSKNIEETLTQIDGVVTARVHIVLPENDVFNESISPSSASVFIKYHPDSNLNSAKTDIKLIVEKSIEGLEYEKISLVMLPVHQNSIGLKMVMDKNKTPGFIWVILLLVLGAVVYFLFRNKEAEQGNSNLAASELPHAGIKNKSGKVEVAEGG